MGPWVLIREFWYYPRGMVCRVGDRAVQPGHTVGPVRPQVSARRSDGRLYVCMPRLRTCTHHRLAGGLPRAGRDRRIGRHGDPTRRGARPRPRSRGGGADVASGTGDGRCADPGAGAGQRRAGVRRLARHLLDPDGVRRDLLRAGGVPVARHAAARAPHPPSPGRAAWALSQHPCRARLPEPCDDGRVRHIRVLRLPRRVVAGVHPGLRPDPTAIRDGVWRQLVWPDLLRAA